ncbi:MAG: cytochrome c-type biosis protein [Gaiellales bacterium]|nr:cytochrome c-type biosis protein [Gaiellales bacterium]
MSRIALAFAAGILSFATPCVLPLVPGYLAALTGAVPGATDPGAGRRAVRAAIPFVLGFACVFVLLGVAAGLLGSAFRGHRDELTMASGILVVAIGFALLGLLPIPALDRMFSPALEPARRSGSPAVMGAAFGLAFTPCMTPVLGGILVLASSSASVPRAAGLLAVYAAGVAVPLLLLALAFGRTITALRFIRDRYELLRRLSGVLLVAFGLLLFTDHVWWLQVAVDHVLRSVGIDTLPSL